MGIEPTRFGAQLLHQLSYPIRVYDILNLKSIVSSIRKYLLSFVGVFSLCENVFIQKHNIRHSIIFLSFSDVDIHSG